MRAHRYFQCFCLLTGFFGLVYVLILAIQASTSTRSDVVVLDTALAAMWLAVTAFLWRSLFVNRRRRPKAVSQTEPIRAWKKAKLSSHPDFGVSLGPIIGFPDKASYRSHATAVCGFDRPHRAPDPDCSCGFYASTPDYVRRQYPEDGVWLEVELYGRVIRHRPPRRWSSPIWRAEKMRVLSVGIPRACVCSRPAVELLVTWTDCALVPVCARCLAALITGPRLGLDGHHYTLAELSGLLGCEVRWDQQEEENHATREN